MMCGKISPAALEVSDMATALQFVKYAHKYDLQGASIAVYDSLKSVIMSDGTVSNGIKEADIEMVFRMSPPGSLLRTLVVQAAITAKGLRDMKKFSKLESTVEGYAQELLSQTRKAFDEYYLTIRYKDPLNGSTIIY